MPSLTDDEIDAVVEMLSQGYGVQDILVKSGISEEVSRRLIRKMRANGTLAEIYRSDDAP